MLHNKRSHHNEKPTHRTKKVAPADQTRDIPLCVFEDAREGDVFNVLRDDAEKEKRLNKAQSLFDKLKKN